MRAPISMQLQATVSVCRLIPQRPACDTTSDAAPARDRCHLKASQTPRDSVLPCLARRQPSASESAPSQAFSRTPTGRSYPRKGSSADRVVRSSRTLPILLLLQIAIQRAQRHAVASAELTSSHATRLIQTCQPLYLRAATTTNHRSRLSAHKQSPSQIFRSQQVRSSDAYRTSEDLPQN